jgi:hypothetical protein
MMGYGMMADKNKIAEIPFVGGNQGTVLWESLLADFKEKAFKKESINSFPRNDHRLIDVWQNEFETAIKKGEDYKRVAFGLPYQIKKILYGSDLVLTPYQRDFLELYLDGVARKVKRELYPVLLIKKNTLEDFIDLYPLELVEESYVYAKKILERKKSDDVNTIKEQLMRVGSREFVKENPELSQKISKFVEYSDGMSDEESSAINSLYEIKNIMAQQLQDKKTELELINLELSQLEEI